MLLPQPPLTNYTLYSPPVNRGGHIEKTLLTQELNPAPSPTVVNIQVDFNCVKTNGSVFVFMRRQNSTRFFIMFLDARITECQGLWKGEANQDLKFEQNLVMVTEDICCAR